MSRVAQQDPPTPLPGGVGQGRPDHKSLLGFTVIELTIVLVILGILASVIAQRHYDEVIAQARQQVARGALAEGQSRLTLATARYYIRNQGVRPQLLADLSPDYMNATSELGDYTAVFSQGAGQVTVEIYPGTATSGTPLTSRTYDWP